MSAPFSFYRWEASAISDCSVRISVDSPIDAALSKFKAMETHDDFRPFSLQGHSSNIYAFVLVSQLFWWLGVLFKILYKIDMNG